ncbi:MAG TPA: alkaline phosphatase family protein [Burkholderiaceae bacterium]
MTHPRKIGLATTLVAAAVSQACAAATTTPIQHVIVVVGENRSFDNLYGTYQPPRGQRIENLLAKGIVNADGTPGRHHAEATQRAASSTAKYTPVTTSTGKYQTLPRPYTTSAIGQPPGVPDLRFPADLPNGPFQISKYAPYSAYTGDPVHRFFQMYEEIDGGAHDKFVWVEETVGKGNNGLPPPAGGFNPMEGAISMGFYNMNPYVDADGVAQPGDAPVFKSFADHYAISDNYHQSVMGGTGANFQAIISADAVYFTNPDGSAGVPYSNQIENPDTWKGTNNYFKQDGYGGGSYVNCADPKQPGVKGVLDLLKKTATPAKCDPGHYYLVNNYNLYWDQYGVAQQLGSDKFTLPPQSVPTIADNMTAHDVSWKYYSADRAADVTRFPTSVDGIPLPFHSYCGICDPLTAYTSIMTTAQKDKLAPYGQFLDDLAAGSLPAVSFVRPFEALAAHPADSTTDQYELFLQDLVQKVQANPSVWATTAIFITTDEGGGYYDSGYIQPVDFFGDGTRIPLVAISPYAKKGYVDHVYNDHASISKFIEANWGLPANSARSRDNLPNPVAVAGNPYVPLNSPAVGDLMSLFDFSQR